MIPYIRGKITQQAHVGVPDGTYEEEYAREGFFGRYAHLYRRNPPVAWLEIDGPLRPRAFDLACLKRGSAGDLLAQRRAVLQNDDVEIHYGHLGAPMPYFYRNADGDEVVFVHTGRGRLDTDFGPLTYEAGDYIVVPRGTVQRWLPESPSEFLTTVTFGEVRFPEKGMIGQHALFDPAMIRVPSPDALPATSAGLPSGDRHELRIRREGAITRVIYPFSPIDVVGWKGTLTVWQLNVRDIRPILSESYHLPPSAHTTFLAPGVAICTFLPRPLETGDPAAMKVPFYHSNIDYDEVLFYHAGEFFSRANIRPGMLTFHPQGIHHGPQPDAVARTRGATRTNEIAVMIDTRRPLQAAPGAEEAELRDYWKSWMKS